MYFAAVFMTETSKEQVLRERFLALGLGSKLKTRKAGEVLRISITRPLVMMLGEPMVFALAVYTSFAFAVIFVFFDVFPLIFQTVYGFDVQEVGLAYLSLLVGFVLSSVNFQILFLLSKSRFAKTGVFKVEDSLHSALIGSILLPGSLFW